ncbi:J domain-containing protein [Candidatus Pacearchaeota archaeon]|nr:J domain-containing protein [Candidatus Pacearchaeota archaeon]
MRDLYEILGIEREATPEDIKAAHRKLIKIHHPDKNGGEESQIFMEIQKTYEVLSSPEDRAVYDKYGFSSGDEEASKINNLISGLVVKLMKGRCSPTLLVNKMESEIKQSLDQLKKERGMMEASLDALRAHKDQLKIKDDSNLDIIGNSILGIMREIETDRLINAGEIKTREKVLEMIKVYEKGEEEVSTARFTLGTFQEGTSTFGR